MENILIPSTLFALVLTLFTWKAKFFSPRRVKIRIHSARYFETTSNVSREG